MQDNILYSYLDDNEKEFAACESAFDIEMDKLELAYEYTNRMQSIHMAQSELKVMNESGTFADLEYLYTEANAEATGKKENIFARMFKAIANFFSNIAEKISSIFTKKAKDEVDGMIKSGEIKPSETVQVEGNPEETLKFIDSIKKKVNNLKGKAFNKRYKVTDADLEEADKIEKEISGKKKALIAVVTTVSVAALSAVGITIGKKAKDNADEAQEDANKLDGENLIGNDKSNPAGDGTREKLLSKIKGILSQIAGMLSTTGKNVTGVFGKLFKKKNKKEKPESQGSGKKPVKSTPDMNTSTYDPDEAANDINAGPSNKEYSGESVDSDLIDFFM